MRWAGMTVDFHSRRNASVAGGWRHLPPAHEQNVGPLLNRLLAHRRETSDTFNLLIFQIARELRPDRPEAVVRDPVTDERLMAIAASAPGHLAEICDGCASVVTTLKSTGRGGRRHEAELADRLVVSLLGTTSNGS
jgi:hypothetical protein